MFLKCSHTLNIKYCLSLYLSFEVLEFVSRWKNQTKLNIWENIILQSRKLQHLHKQMEVSNIKVSTSSEETFKSDYVS